MRGNSKRLQALDHAIRPLFLLTKRLLMHVDGRLSGTVAAEFPAIWQREYWRVSGTPRWLREMLSLCVLAITRAEFRGGKWGRPCQPRVCVVSALKCSHYESRILFTAAGGKHESPGVASATCSTVKWAKYIHYNFAALLSENMKGADFNINRIGSMSLRLLWLSLFKP